MDQKHETIMTAITTAASPSLPTSPAESEKPKDLPPKQPQPSKSLTSAHEVPEALLRPSPVPASDQITLYTLAQELRTTQYKVWWLIDNGYLRLMQRRDPHYTSIVARPYPAALEWLRGMLAPLRLRPMLPLEGVAENIGLSLNDVRRMAIHYDIPLAMDPLFGELISTTGYNRLLRAQYELRTPLRTDRQAMMLMMVRANRHVSKTIKMKAVSYSQRLEQEIRDICKLPEPLRSLRAAALWTAYSEAKTVAECVKGYAGILKEEKVSGASKALQASMEFMRDQITSSAKYKWVRNVKNPRIQRKLNRQRERWSKMRAEKANAAEEGGEPSSSES